MKYWKQYWKEKLSLTIKIKFMKNISVYVLNADKLQEDLESSKENIIKFGKKYSLEEFETCFNVPSEFGGVHQENQWIAFVEEKPEITYNSIYSKVDLWIDRNLNFIPLDVYRTILNSEIGYIPCYSNDENNLIDFWRYDKTYKEKQKIVEEYFYEFPPENEITELIESKLDDIIDEEDFKEWLIEQDVWESYKSDIDNDNEPTWGTVFEFNSGISEEFILNPALKNGFIVMEESEHFNICLGFNGGGYDFYESHWVPLWLELYGSEEEKLFFKNRNNGI